MRDFIESLKRLYENHLVSYEKVVDLCDNPKNTITQEEKKYILGEEGT